MTDISTTRTSVCMAVNAAKFLCYTCCVIGLQSMQRGSCISGNKAIAKGKANGSG